MQCATTLNANIDVLHKNQKQFKLKADDTMKTCIEKTTNQWKAILQILDSFARLFSIGRTFMVPQWKGNAWNNSGHHTTLIDLVVSM